MARREDLRPKQAESIDALRDGLVAGHNRQLLVGPTGFGKTTCAAHLLRLAYEKGSRSAFVVDRTSLVDQASATLDRYGIPHGVIQANHWRRMVTEPIQVCSAQTLERRGIHGDWKLMILDEAHCVRQGLVKWMQRHDAVRIVGLTATPFTAGLSDLYSNVVNVTTTNEEIASGYLVPLRMYAARAIDMTGAKVVAGEWAESEIEKRGTEIVGDVVSEWVTQTQKHFGGPAKTLVFSATVAHGDELVRQFQAAGYNFIQISYKDGSDEDRRAIIEEFRKPNSSIHGLISCEALTKGFDVPDVLVGVACRPYRKSFSSHIQQLGRVMRAAPGKTFGLWLDHCGNALRFLEDQTALFAHGVQALDEGELDRKTRKEPDEGEKAAMKCHACGFVLPGGVRACPACGAERARRQSTIDAIPGRMFELDGSPAVDATPAYLRDRTAVWAQLTGMGLDRKKGDVDAARKWATGQYKSLYGEWPGLPFNPDMGVPPSDAVRRKVMQQVIAFAKAREAQRAPA
ncbi:MAG: helicase [Burkholderiales bacterium]|nr:MAG: helicase [Burkholderiales bacterium]